MEAAAKVGTQGANAPGDDGEIEYRLDLAAGVLDVTLHLFRNGFVHDEKMIEGLFVNLVALLGVAQHKRRDRTGAEDANDELYKKALRVKQLVCHVIECILEMRLTIRLCSFLTSLRRHETTAKTMGVVGLFRRNASRKKSERGAAPPDLSNGAPKAADPVEKQSLLGGAESSSSSAWSRPRPPPVSTAAEPPAAASTASAQEAARKATKGWGRIAQANLIDGLREATSVLAWKGATDDMIRALVRTTTEAKGVDHNCELDALRVLVRLFRQSQSMCACMLSVEFVRRARGEGRASESRERIELQSMQRALSFLRYLSLSLRALVGTAPHSQVSEVLSSAREAIDQLTELAKTPHQQNLLWCIGASDAVLEIVHVLLDIERAADTSTQRLARLPADLLRAAREAAFEFLTAYVKDNRRNQAEAFAHFSVVLTHMAGVRAATTCAAAMLAGHAANCAAVTDAHLDQLVALMSGGSARYAWYIDVLLTLTRGLANLSHSVPLAILRKLLAKPSYLLVLFPGAAGREKRARHLAAAPGPIADHSIIGYHHAVVQLLAELANGFHVETEMLVQSIVPLPEVAPNAPRPGSEADWASGELEESCRCSVCEARLGAPSFSEDGPLVQTEQRGAAAAVAAAPKYGFTYR